MKRAVVTVSGGVAYIKENDHNLSIKTIDFDDNSNITPLNKAEMNKFDAVVYVRGGIAEIVYESEGVRIEIIDYD